ncbi:MAG: hypothetical protein ACD_64C00269G0002 [uncultured bacterium]|nr:MAG: hypothetical protein ACD_64C00269G0002 [uncultured bacterium]HLE76334.1 hypothetical protein [Candidatus Babeliales bacterium]
MNEHPFTAFIDLISLDQQIRTIHQKITTLTQETETHLSEKKKIVDRLEQFKQHVHDLKKVVHEKELSIKAIDALEKQKKAQLDNFKSAKEYQPLKKEIDRLKQEQHDTEASLMAIWNKLEGAQKELDEQKASYSSKIEELHTAIAQQHDQIAQLQTELTRKKSERPSKEAGIPQEWLDKYTHMRMRVEDPVISLLDDNCSACYYTVANQELIRLKRRAIVQCKGCFRLLYMKEAMNPESQQATDTSKE